MFKLITYKNQVYHKNIDATCFTFHIIDSNFECDIPIYIISSWSLIRQLRVISAAVITEYRSRNLDVVKNLYLFNVFVQNNWHIDNLDILSIQNQIDEFCKIEGLDFSKEIYPKLKQLHDVSDVFR